MGGRLGGVVVLAGIVVLAIAGLAVVTQTDLLAGAGGDRTERAAEPAGAKKDPPEAAKAEKKDEKPKAKKDGAKKEDKKESREQQKKETGDKEQAAKAKKEPAPPPAEEEESASAAASAPADTTMTLDVPAIGISVPVYEGTTEASLSAGTGHLSGTGYPWVPGSNTYVAGHRVGYPGTASDYVFWDLPSLGIGDEVYLTDANGKTYDYAVNEILEVPITDLSVTEPVGEDVVSLQTCIENYGDYWTEGPNWNVRYVVRAEKV